MALSQETDVHSETAGIVKAENFIWGDKGKLFVLLYFWK